MAGSDDHLIEFLRRDYRKRRIRIQNLPPDHRRRARASAGRGVMEEARFFDSAAIQLDRRPDPLGWSQLSYFGQSRVNDTCPCVQVESRADVGANVTRDVIGHYQLRWAEPAALGSGIAHGEMRHAGNRAIR